jgi:hypothetical protein
LLGESKHGRPLSPRARELFKPATRHRAFPRTA